MDQVKVQGAIKSQMEGKAGVLKAEIKQDAGRGDVEKKKEELAAVEAKAQDIEASQMSAISGINKKLEEAAKEDQKAAKTEGKIDKKDNTEKTKAAEGKDEATETEEQEQIQNEDIPIPPNNLPDGVDIGTSEPIGNNVDVKL